MTRGPSVDRSFLFTPTLGSVRLFPGLGFRIVVFGREWNESCSEGVLGGDVLPSVEKCTVRLACLLGLSGLTCLKMFCGDFRGAFGDPDVLSFGLGV